MIDRIVELRRRLVVIEEEPLNNAWARWATSVRRVISRFPLEWHSDGRADDAFAPMLRVPIPQFKWLIPFGVTSTRIPILPRLLDPKNESNLPTSLDLDVALYLNNYYKKHNPSL